LQSVLSQEQIPFDVIVLDDASSKCQLEAVVGPQFSDDRLHFLRSEAPLGVARGRNFLMARATGDVFVIIDDDAYFASKDALSCIVEIFRSYPQAGIIACKIVNYRAGGKRQLQLPFSQRVRQKRPAVIRNFGKVSYFIGCGHAVHRTVIATCGPYSEALTYGEEELELSFRAIEAGFSIYYLPQVVVKHFPEPSVVARPQNIKHAELYYHTHNRFYLAYRYLPWKYVPVHLSIWLLRYGVGAIKTGGITEVLAGIRDGLQTVKRTERTPLRPQAVKYLQTNYGRLWY
jgi:GT2 family glycosyltransferase